MIAFVSKILIICCLLSLSFRGSDVGENDRWRPSQVKCSATRKMVELQCNGKLSLQGGLFLSGPSKVTHFLEIHKNIKPRHETEDRFAIISINFKIFLGITHEKENTIILASYVSDKSSHNFGINGHFLQVKEHLRST